METTTDDMSVKPSIKIKVNVRFSTQEDLDEILTYCKERFGHRGKEAGWWWRINGKWKDRKAVFMFKNEEDAMAFKLTKGELCR